MRIMLEKSMFEELLEVMEKATWTQMGKHLETRTDKKGHSIRKWIKNADNQPSKKYPGMRRGEEKDYKKNINKYVEQYKNMTEGNYIEFKDRNGQKLEGTIQKKEGVGLVVKSKGGVLYQVDMKNVVSPRSMKIDPKNFDAVSYSLDNGMDMKITPDEKGIQYFLDKYYGEEGKEIAEEIVKIEKKLKDLKDAGQFTDTLYKIGGEGENAMYTKERVEKVHIPIFAKYLNKEKIKNATPKPGKKPQLVMLGGRGGAGKSNFTSSANGNTPLYDETNYIKIDPDEIKEMIPEYEGWNAGQVHVESSDLAAKIIKMCLDKNMNVIIDGTMSWEPRVLEQIEMFSNAGYECSVDMMFVPNWFSMKSAVGRWKGNDGKFKGRYVPLGALASMTGCEKTFDDVKPKVKDWSFRDFKDRSKKPVLISELNKKS